MSNTGDDGTTGARAGRSVRNATDLMAGMFLVICGLAAWWFGQPLKVGTAFRMGPGYVPILLAWILVCFGLALCGLGLMRPGSPPERWRLRPLLLVTGALIVFGLTIERTGLFIASILSVSIAASAGAKQEWREIGLLALCLAIGACLLFPLALQLTLKVWP